MLPTPYIPNFLVAEYYGFTIFWGSKDLASVLYPRNEKESQPGLGHRKLIE
jgi:hypothetical protein